MIPVAALVIIIIGFLFYRSLAVLPFAFGVIITSVLNIIKVRMLERTVEKIVNMDDQETGKIVIRFQYLIRYFLTAIVLVAIGLIHNYTTPPPFYSSRETHLGVWAILFPNAPEALLSAPLISIIGALAGIFTMQISVILVRALKLEKDGDNFIEYVDDEDEGEDDKGDGDEAIDEEENVNKKEIISNKNE